jgi:hypothetical protein
MEPATELISFNEEKVDEYFSKLMDELTDLDKLNQNNKDKTLDSIQATQYGAAVANEIPVLLARIRAFQNNVGFYEFHLNRLTKNAGK